MKMSSDSKFFVGVIVAAVLAVLGFILFSGNGDQTVDVAAGDAYKIGPDSAKVKIIAFEDFQCPACKAAEEPLRLMLDEYEGRVQFTFRHFPLPSHPHAEEAALAAEAAGSLGKFWEMKELLYDTQDSWSSLQNPDNFFGELATELELDLGKFKDAYKSNNAKERVKADLAAGQQAGASQTPTFYVNGKEHAGSQSLENWKTIIAEAEQSATE